MPSRRQRKPTKALDSVQIIDFSSTDTIQCEVPIDPLLTQPESLPESLPESTTPSQLATKDDRIEWTPLMIKTLFEELLEQAQDGKRADNGFKCKV
jgi:hypothetical protein